MSSCINKHKLEIILFDDSESSCDGCGAQANSSSQRFQCTMGCEYKFCEGCASKSDPAPDIFITPRCLDGHKLVISKISKKWACSARREQGGCRCGTGRTGTVSTQLRYTCSQCCDYDICGLCYDTRVVNLGSKLTPQVSSSSQVLLNSAGILTYPAYDLRHFKTNSSLLWEECRTSRIYISL